MKSIQSADVRRKRVIVRVDMNVPFDAKGRIRDDFRIRESLPTLRWILAQGGKLFVATHYGEPDGHDRCFSALPIAKHVSRLLGRQVRFVKDPTRENPKDFLEWDVLFSENLRFWRGEKENSETFQKALSRWGDLYVNDAFAVSHRTSASIVGLPRLLPSFAGFLLQKEIDRLRVVIRVPKHPFLVIAGGAKAETKVPYLLKIAKTADAVILGGVLFNTLLFAEGHSVGKSLIEKTMMREVTKLPQRKLFTPDDVMVLGTLDKKGTPRFCLSNTVKRDEYIVDIGPLSIKKFSEVVHKAKTILWNGPLGYTDLEVSSRGTEAVADLLKRSKARIVIGGGDLIGILEKKKMRPKNIYYSTGGGALLEFVAMGTLPGIEALNHNAMRIY